MATIAQLLEHNRKELLDLSGRNRLLSIPKDSKSARLIHIVDERSDQIYRIIVEDKKTMSFLAGARTSGRNPSNEDEESPDYLPMAIAADSEEETGGVASRHLDSKLQTALTPEGLQRRLISLQTDARTIQEEQGINVLFLSLGQLKWKEDESAEKARFAPLVLIPVELERLTATEKFRLRWTDQEIQENLSLVEKLRGDFDLTMPEFGEHDGFDITAYFAAIAAIIRSRPGWEVLPNEITLGFFSFQKLMMYRDLIPANWPDGKKIDENLLIAGLLSDGLPNNEPLFDETKHLDDLIPVERLDHVVDADGSQTVVVEIARSGRNLVVQGPPGTGKSQTICNIIAAAVLEKKRVLFVAEKLAALEVVKRRLTANGLGSLCLELHSNKANKRTVLDDIGKTWKLGRPVNGGHEKLFTALQELRSKLNLHCAILHCTMEPSGLTAFRILGQLAKLRQAGWQAPDLEFSGAEKWTEETAEKNRQAVNELAERVTIIGPPSQNPWRGSRRKNYLRIDETPLMRKFQRLEVEVQSLRNSRSLLSTFLDELEPTTISAVIRLVLQAEHILIAPEFDRDAICNTTWNAGLDGLREIIVTGRRFAEIAANCAEQVTADAWIKDLVRARTNIAAHGESIFRVFKSEYRLGCRDFRACLVNPLPKKHAERLSLMDQLVEGQRLLRMLAELAPRAQSAFGHLWRKQDSDWAKLEEIVNWVAGRAKVGLQTPIQKLFAVIEERERLRPLTADVKDSTVRLTDAFEQVRAELDLDLLQSFNESEFGKLNLNDIESRVIEWQVALDRFSEWISYYSCTEALRTAGCGALVDAAQGDRKLGANLSQVFDWTYYSQLLREAVKRYPELGSFDGLLHEIKVDNFRSADRQRLEASKLRTLIAHYEQMPMEGDGVGVTGVIKGEMARKRGHMPIRKLLGKTGHAIQAIKPVFMMSPLSVAQYLEPGGIEFDLLVIDEASQVEPVDALGAIARCKQVVVVGDDKQLPPSHFFMRMTSESSDEEFEGEETGATARDLESILGLCRSRGIPQKMLRWHYRSRHHSLIAASNHEFYEDNLFIVPSPYPASEELGLLFIHIPDGIFDTGKTRVNRLEAKRVAGAVIEHAEKYPKFTLGVAAFSVQQRQAIQDELELLRRERPDTEPFFNDHPHEPFFVKNLENVQGDERDVIFISIGYARDASGFMAMRFGPLSNDGGERRLNVLISRAKQRCVVFSSIKSDDIDLNRATGRGVAALKSFLRFAETGILGIAQKSGREEDSPFEESVRSELEKHGLTIDPQVGEAGFFIDLAVRNPDLSGAYILGIECDGATYHSSRSARDRDRLRQAVLEDHGWVIHRIWSTDWFQRPDRELRRVLVAVENARGKAKRSASSKTNNAEAASPNGDGNGATLVERVHENEPEAEPYAFAKLEVPSYVELQTLAPGQLVRHVTKVLETEAPISIDEIVLRVRTAWGYERAGNRIFELVEKATRLAMATPAYAMEEGFIVNRTRPARPRRRDEWMPASLRKPENIPPQEIRSAVILLVERHLGAGINELCGAVARLLGFKATSAQFRTMVEVQIQRLLRSGILLENNGVVQRADNAIPGTPIRKE
jgi:very-short-patch-repair endonuclease